MSVLPFRRVVSSSEQTIFDRKKKTHTHRQKIDHFPDFDDVSACKDLLSIQNTKYNLLSHTYLQQSERHWETPLLPASASGHGRGGTYRKRHPRTRAQASLPPLAGNMSRERASSARLQVVERMPCWEPLVELPKQRVFAQSGIVSQKKTKISKST